MLSVGGGLARRGASSAPLRLRPLLRSLCAEADIRLRNAYTLLSLPKSASRQQIKRRYYELAKQTHPDLQSGPVAAGPTMIKDAAVGLLDDAERAPGFTPSLKFLEVQQAFETLIETLENGGAARGPGGFKKASARPRYAKTKTLAEVLVERLADEPEALAEVWRELCDGKLSLTGGCLDSALRATARSGGRGLVMGLEMLSEGSELGIVNQQASSTQSAGGCGAAAAAGRRRRLRAGCVNVPCPVACLLSVSPCRSVSPSV